MSKLRPLLVFGTRPEAIKMAPVVRQCWQRPNEIEALICFSGQHREMLAQVTDYFGITPDLDLQLMRPNQTLAGLTANCLQALDQVLVERTPDCVVAQGDTTTVLASALAAFYRRVPFVHVEAGLRTGNLYAPYPEELNRRAASIVTTLHCAPTRRAAAHLLAEGVPASQIQVTGNTVIDALLWTREREQANAQRWRDKFALLGDRRLVLITGHRRENFGDGLEQICQAVAVLADCFADVEFVYPVHLNPRVQEPVLRLLGGRANVHLLAPLPYPEFVWLMDRSTLILTDSGGVQEEAPSLRKPVLVMRDVTERPEAVEVGAVEVVGTDPLLLVRRVSELLTDEKQYERLRPGVNPYGDGQAARRIVEWMLHQGWNARG
jgi:UDP-N-acetylglucosamine 2-epimerase (non-hydrolysing)